MRFLRVVWKPSFYFVLFQVHILGTGRASATCYCKEGAEGINTGCDGRVPCSNDAGVQTCCRADDECGDDGFCHFTDRRLDNTSGYYLGGCTDPTFKDPRCGLHCSESMPRDAADDKGLSVE